MMNPATSLWSPSRSAVQCRRSSTCRLTAAAGSTTISRSAFSQIGMVAPIRRGRTRTGRRRAGRPRSSRLTGEWSGALEDPGESSPDDLGGGRAAADEAEEGPEVVGGGEAGEEQARHAGLHLVVEDREP